MRRNTAALGFIPDEAIKYRFVAAGHYVIQRDRNRKPIGYLIHGPVHANGVLHIHQACIELDRRNRGFGARAVHTLIDRARIHHAKRILLRCASDLDAVAFWISCGFLPTHATPGGVQRRRTIIHYELHLEEIVGTPHPGMGFAWHPACAHPIGLTAATSST